MKSKSRYHSYIAASLLLLLAGCGGSNGTSSNYRVPSGTYNVTFANGEGDAQFELIIKTDNSLSGTGFYKPTQPSGALAESTQVFGYLIDGDHLFFNLGSLSYSVLIDVKATPSSTGFTGQYFDESAGAPPLTFTAVPKP